VRDDQYTARGVHARSAFDVDKFLAPSQRRHGSCRIQPPLHAVHERRRTAFSLQRPLRLLIINRFFRIRNPGRTCGSVSIVLRVVDAELALHAVGVNRELFVRDGPRWVFELASVLALRRRPSQRGGRSEQNSTPFETPLMTGSRRQPCRRRPHRPQPRMMPAAIPFAQVLLLEENAEELSDAGGSRQVRPVTLRISAASLYAYRVPSAATMSRPLSLPCIA
jgi:hypothetical protein